MSVKTDALRNELHGVSPENNLTSVLAVVDPLIDDLEIVMIDDLPTEDPLVAGQIWNDTGVPTISAG